MRVVTSVLRVVTRIYLLDIYFIISCVIFFQVLPQELDFGDVGISDIKGKVKI